MGTEGSGGYNYPKEFEHDGVKWKYVENTKGTYQHPTDKTSGGTPKVVTIPQKMIEQAVAEEVTAEPSEEVAPPNPETARIATEEIESYDRLTELQRKREELVRSGNADPQQLKTLMEEIGVEGKKYGEIVEQMFNIAEEAPVVSSTPKIPNPSLILDQNERWEEYLRTQGDE